jgi:hypothetical protein
MPTLPALSGVHLRRDNQGVNIGAAGRLAGFRQEMPFPHEAPEGNLHASYPHPAFDSQSVVGGKRLQLTIRVAPERKPHSDFIGREPTLLRQMTLTVKNSIGGDEVPGTGALELIRWLREIHGSILTTSCRPTSQRLSWSGRSPSSSKEASKSWASTLTISARADPEFTDCP